MPSTLTYPNGRDGERVITIEDKPTKNTTAEMRKIGVLNGIHYLFDAPLGNTEGLFSLTEALHDRGPHRVQVYTTKGIQLTLDTIGLATHHAVAVLINGMFHSNNSAIDPSEEDKFGHTETVAQKIIIAGESTQTPAVVLLEQGSVNDWHTENPDATTLCTITDGQIDFRRDPRHRIYLVPNHYSPRELARILDVITGSTLDT